MRRAFSAPYSRALRGMAVVVGLVGLAEIGGVGVGDRAVALHPVEGGGGVEAAGEGYAYALVGGEGFEDYGHKGPQL